MTGSPTEPAELLKGVELFRGLSHRQLHKIIAISRVVDHPTGHVVTKEGLGALAFHLILEGQAVVSCDGTELRRLGPGDHFGEVSLIDGHPRSATVTAATPLKAFVVPHPGFQQLLDHDPEFTRQVLLSLCALLRAAEARRDSTAV
jgi:CRP/FNR family transcriptional regulator, cyclic AMP receptor protein